MKLKRPLLAVVWLMAGSLALEAAWTTKRLTYNSGESTGSYVAVSGSNVCAVWENDSLGNCELFFRKSVNGGLDWQSVQRLTKNS